MEKKKIFVIGGDVRQYYLAMELEKKEFKITCYGMERLEEEKFVKVPETLEKGMLDNDVILLPVPVLQDNLQVNSKEKKILLKDIQKYIRKGHIVFGGNIPKSFLETCEKKEAFCVDYMRLEKTTLKNAEVTGEGALVEAAKLGNRTIQGSGCLIIGFGRCGEALAERLSAWGADVTVMARSKEARSKAEFCGYHARDMFEKEGIKEEENQYQFIFNTVPAMILDKNAIDSILQEKEKEEYPIIIDIASKLGGVDFEYCRKKEVKAGLYPGIPGKYAPKTAGVILSQAVLESLKKKNEIN